MSSLYPHCFWRGHRAVKVWFIAEANHVDESLNMEQHGRVKIERKFSVLNKIKQRIRPAVHLMQQRSSSLQRRKQGRKSEKMNLLHTGPLTCCLLSNNVVLRMWKWRCDEWGWPGMMCPWAELMHAQAEFDNSRTPTHFQCCNVGAWRASCDSKLIKSRCIKQTSFQPFLNKRSSSSLSLSAPALQWGTVVWLFILCTPNTFRGQARSLGWVGLFSICSLSPVRETTLPKPNKIKWGTSFFLVWP